MVLVLEDLGGFAFASCWGVLSCSVGSGSQKMRSFSFAFNLCWNALLVLVGAKKGRWFSFSFGSWDVLLVGSSYRCSSCPIDSQDTEVRNCPMIRKEKIEAKRKRKSRQDWQEIDEGIYWSYSNFSFRQKLDKFWSVSLVFPSGW